MMHLAGLSDVCALPGYEESTTEFVTSVLGEAGRFATRILAPINQSGDQQGARWNSGIVTTPDGFKEAYRQFVAAGWNGVGGNPVFGGQGMPKLVVAALQEMWKTANLSFSLAPLLTVGASEALILCASEALKRTYLPRMISGQWTGTMNLTEPQAGTDLGLIRTRATLQPDGSYLVVGQKIFITYGDQDWSENIIHLVLARTPGAPAGVRGISMFLVPKVLLKADGSLGARNDVQCVSIEHKLGIHGSPTCVMSYGDMGGAVGFLVGEENHGLEYMFIMMNSARFAVGLEGLAVSEGAYQKAVAYARARVQSRDLAGGKDSVTIIHHPDVRRMLMTMRSKIEAMRALAYVVAARHDIAAKHPDASLRKQHQQFVDLMIPVVKGWCTETGQELTSLGVQVHGGMGYIEETGAAQYMRDARITTIYEGTTGIQANDLAGRKIGREGGLALTDLIAEMTACVTALGTVSGEHLVVVRSALQEGIDAVATAGSYIAKNYVRDMVSVSVGAVPFLELLGVVAGGWQLARAAIVAQKEIDAGRGDAFYGAKIITARFYADHVLTAAAGLAQTVVCGAPGALLLANDDF